MPRLDRTGPLGAGPGTGRGLGRCGFVRGAGIGAGAGGLRGVGRGGAPWGGGAGRCFGGRGMELRRNPYAGAAPFTPSEEAEMLKAQLAAAEDEITALKNRLEELEKKGQTQ